MKDLITLVNQLRRYDSGYIHDIQRIDVPMNYLSLYMRPVIFSTLALIYRVWLDLQKAGNQAENR